MTTILGEEALGAYEGTLPRLCPEGRMATGSDIDGWCTWHERRVDEVEQIVLELGPDAVVQALLRLGVLRELHPWEEP